MRPPTSTPNSRRRLSFQQLLLLTETLTELLASGIALQEALNLCAEFQFDRYLHQVTSELSEQLNSGNRLERVLSGDNSPFPHWYQGIFALAEHSGDAGAVFTEMQGYLRQQQNIREKMLSASLYPLFVLLLATVGLLSFAVFFLPQLLDLFAGFSPDAAVEMSRSLRNMVVGAIVLLASCIAMALIHRQYTEVRSNRPGSIWLIYERIVLSLPVIGKLQKETELLRLFFALKLLHHSGIQIDEALQRSSAFINLIGLNSSVQSIRGKIISGQSMDQAMKSEGDIFPATIIRWIEIGEQTGDANTSFERIYEYLRRHIDSSIDRFITLLEPALTVIMGLGILALVLNFIVPFFSIFTEVL